LETVCSAFEGVTFLEVLQGLAATPEPVDVGEAQAEAVRFGAGLDLLGPHLGDGGVTIGSTVERMRAAGEHAKAERRRVATGVVIDRDE
jgi:hypothetical protein